MRISFVVRLASLALLAVAGCGGKGGGGGDFTLGVSQATLFAFPGADATVEVIVVRDGFKKAVDVSVTGLPSGATADPLLIAGSDTAGTLTIHAAPGAVQAAATITLDGTSGSKTRSTTLAFAIRGLAGALDTTFGTSGLTTAGDPAKGENGVAVAIDPVDDSIVVLSRVAVGTTGDFALTRFDANGTLDAAFGTGGTVVTDGGGQNDDPRDVKIAADGKIVVAGGTGTDFVVLRYNANGALDGSFGSGGKIIDDVGVSSLDFAQAVLPLPDGRILVGGSSDTDGVVAAYLANGTPDTSWAGTGVAFLEAGNNGNVSGLVRNADGTFYASSRAGLGAGGTIRVVKLAANGQLVTAFGTAGEAIAGFGTTGTISTALAVQADGAIVVAAGTQNTNAILVRFTSAGVLDTTFGDGADGNIELTFVEGPVSIQDLVIAGGASLIAGNVSTGNFSSFVARTSSTGALDPSFGTAGRTINLFGGTSSACGGLAVQSDGRIVCGGFALVGASAEVSVSRYWP